MVLPVLGAKRETTYRVEWARRIPWSFPRSNQQQQQQQQQGPCTVSNSFILSSSLQLHSSHYTGAKQTILFGFEPWLPAGHDNGDDCRTKGIPRIDNSNNNKVPVLFLIHLFPALTCNYIPSITLVLSKQTTLQPNSPWPLTTMTMTTVSRTVSKKEFHESTTATMTTTASAPSLLRIHSFPALACNCTPVTITLVLSKLVSLASDHGFFRLAVSNKQHNNQHVGRWQCRTPTMSDATPAMSAIATIDEYVSIYASIASIASVTATV